MNPQTHRTRVFYDRFAPLHDQVLALTALCDKVDPIDERETLMRQLHLQPGQHVLEVGVGTGTNLTLCARHLNANSFLAGVDVSAEMLARCTDKLHSTHIPFGLVRGNALHRPLATACMDVVFTFGMLNLVPDKSEVDASGSSRRLHCAQ